MDGLVKWFNNSKGFGFIEAEGQDYFMHYKDIDGDGYKMAEEGQKASFDAKNTERGLKAVNVKLS